MFAFAWSGPDNAWRKCQHEYTSAPGWGFDHADTTGMKRETCPKCGSIRWTVNGRITREGPPGNFDAYGE